MWNLPHEILSVSPSGLLARQMPANDWTCFGSPAVLQQGVFSNPRKISYSYSTTRQQTCQDFLSMSVYSTVANELNRKV